MLIPKKVDARQYAHASILYFLLTWPKQFIGFQISRAAVVVVRRLQLRFLSSLPCFYVLASECAIL
jgi:hypothetical protein